MEITTIIDIIIAILFLQAIFTGFFRGLVVMVARLVAALVAYFGAMLAAESLKSVIADQWILPALTSRMEQGSQFLAGFALEKAAGGLSYLVVFLVVFTLLQILFRCAINLLKVVDRIPMIGMLNRLGGAIAGFFLVFLILFLIGNLFFRLIPEELLRNWGFTQKAIRDTIFLQSFVP